MKRRGFLAAVAGLVAAPALIEKIRDWERFEDGKLVGKDAYVATYRSYHKLVTIDRADMQREGRTFVDVAEKLRREVDRMYFGGANGPYEGQYFT